VGHRLLKVNESVKEVVSAVIAEGLKDPRVGFVTVTGVETSRDLRHAKVFFSVLGGPRERAATLDGLKASHGYLQARVNEALHMKRTPQLVFVYDETTDKAMRIERLLHREAEELGDTPPDFGDPEEGAEPATDPAAPGDEGEDEG
jgi:ribosome-binding factor A